MGDAALLEGTPPDLPRPARRRSTPPLAAFGLGVLIACGGDPPQDGAETPAGDDLGPPAFVDVAAASGLRFVHFNGASGRFYTAEVNCGGGGLIDYDGDGDLDAYLVQGALLEPGATLDDALFPPPPPPLTDRLYRNDLVATADGPTEVRLTDVTAESGVEVADRFGCGVTAGDVDRDGWRDLYVSNFVGANQLLRNRGDGRFEDATAASGTGDPRASVAASFFDYDRDGWLDLVVVNNMAHDYVDPIICHDLAGRRDYCGPGAYPFESDRLYRNRGDGTFEDVSAAAGLGGRVGPALGVVAGDLDGDGWPDLYVANDGQPNQLWINRRDGTFVEQAMLSGSAVNAAGQSEASMGVAAADFDDDGDLDLFLTHLIRETNTLYRNDGRGLFEDRTTAAGLGAPSLPYTSFGTAFFDYDNDGGLDLLVANGAVNLLPDLVDAGDPYPLHQKNQLFRHVGGGRYREVSEGAGEVFRLSEVSRAAAFGDLDNDGDPDVLVVNNNGPARLLLNRLGQRRRWLGLCLVHRGAVDAIGARAALRSPGRPTQWRWVRTDGSYGATHDPRILFGRGDDATAASVRIEWPDGRRHLWRGLPSDRYGAVSSTPAEGR